MTKRKTKQVIFTNSQPTVDVFADVQTMFDRQRHGLATRLASRKCQKFGDLSDSGPGCTKLTLVSKFRNYYTTLANPCQVA